MFAAAQIALALQGSIVLTVFTLGIPVVAAVGAAAFDFHPRVKIALIALAVSPVPSLLPRKGLKTGADIAYTGPAKRGTGRGGAGHPLLSRRSERRRDPWRHH